MTNKHSHYHKDVSHLKSIDVYRTLELFGVTDQALGHAIKKLMCAGQRGAGKSFEQDVREAVDTLNRRLQMLAEDDKLPPKAPVAVPYSSPAAHVPVAHLGGVAPAAPVASRLPVDFFLAGKTPPARPREGQTHMMEIFKHTGERFTSVWEDVVHNEDWSQVLGYRFNASAPLPPA